MSGTTPPVAQARLAAGDADAWLAGMLSLARPQVLQPAWHPHGLAAVGRALAEAPGLLAPVLAAELMPLLGGERLEIESSAVPTSLRPAVRQWEDEVLARLLADARFGRLMDAVAALPPGQRPVAAALVAVRLHQTLQWPEGPGVGPAGARRWAQRTLPELREAGAAALEDPRVGAALAQALERAARATRRHRQLLHDADLVLARHVAVLERLGPRVALAHLLDVAEQLEARPAPRPRLLTQPDGDAPTALEAESTYPVGGFSSVSTRGALENLVTSELVWMEGDAGARPDLFDLRYAEGELLYFERDEGVASRRRRSLLVGLDASLVQARVLDPGEAVQRLGWVLGAVVVLARRLTRWLSGEALTLELRFPAGGVLDDERELLKLALAAEVERGVVRVTTPGEPPAARGGGQERALLWGAVMPSGLEGPGAPAGWVDVSSPVPRVYWRTGPAAPAAGPGALEAWTSTLGELAAGVLGGKGRASAGR